MIKNTHNLKEESYLKRKEKSISIENSKNLKMLYARLNKKDEKAKVVTHKAKKNTTSQDSISDDLSDLDESVFGEYNPKIYFDDYIANKFNLPSKVSSNFEDKYQELNSLESCKLERSSQTGLLYKNFKRRINGLKKLKNIKNKPTVKINMSNEISHIEINLVKPAEKNNTKERANTLKQ